MEIEILRMEVDEIDRKIVRLLEKRNENVLRIGQLKESVSKPVEDLERERVILETVAGACPDRSIGKSLRRIFRTILKESKRIQSEHRLRGLEVTK